MSGITARVLGKLYDFPGLQQVAYVRRTYWDGSENVSEGRYFLTSKPRNRLSARRFLQKITSHWEIENSLHNVKDKHWNEDKQFTIRGVLGTLQSALRSLSLNVLRILQIPGVSDKSSLSKKALELLARPLNALKLISKI